MMRVIALLCFFAVLSGCGESKEEELDRFDRGVIHVSCDETFRPVMDAQVAVYQNEFPNVRIIVHYKPEAECLRDLFVDSIRMVIATRSFSEAERAAIIDSLGVGPVSKTVARDAVAVLVHPQNPDSFYTMDEIRALVGGKGKQNVIPVFDGVRATSTVRFMLDSVMKGGSLGNNAAAAQSSNGVIEYVSKTPRAVGFVGLSWIGNPEDPVQRSYLKQVRMARVESTDSADAYVLPLQYILYTDSYPMVRDLVYIVKESHLGLGKAFGKFLESERGQLVFRRAYLRPAIMPFYMRNAELREDISE